MTDDKIEAAASVVAMEKVNACFSEGETDRVRARAHKAAKYAYIAGHRSRDAEVAELRARLEEVEARAVRWVKLGSDEFCALTTAGWFAPFTATMPLPNRPSYLLMVPKVPLPETKL